MATLDEWLAGLLSFLGPLALLVAVFLVFVVDAAVFPALPELAFVVTYWLRPAGMDPTLWNVLLLLMAIAGEAVGNSALYLAVRHVLVDRGRMPRVVEWGMKRWTGFLFFHDERIILVNRIAPVMPMVGAFIATLKWNYPKSLAYIVVGAGAKYTLLLVLVQFLGVSYDPVTARWVTIALILALVAISFIAAEVRRRRTAAPPAGGA